MAEMPPPHAQNIRSVIGDFIGDTIVEITQHDPEEFRESGSRVYFHFASGRTLSFPIGEDGFDIDDPRDDDA